MLALVQPHLMEHSLVPEKHTCTHISWSCMKRKYSQIKESKKRQSICKVNMQEIHKHSNFTSGTILKRKIRKFFLSWLSLTTNNSFLEHSDYNKNILFSHIYLSLYKEIIRYLWNWISKIIKFHAWVKKGRYLIFTLSVIKCFTMTNHNNFNVIPKTWTRISIIAIIAILKKKGKIIEFILQKYYTMYLQQTKMKKTCKYIAEKTQLRMFKRFNRRENKWRYNAKQLWG